MIAGLDVSEFQGDLPWASLYAAGVRFAFIRLGDGTYLDPKAGDHKAGAQAAGIKVAPYWFCRDREDPIAQTERFLVRAMDWGHWDGPLVPDYEAAGMLSGNPRSWLERAIQRIEAHYPQRKLFYYSGWYLLRDRLGASPVFTRHFLWMPGGPRYNEEGASIASSPGAFMDAPAGFTIKCFQWTQFGRAGGYGGNLDLNVMAEDAFAEFFGVATPDVQVDFDVQHRPSPAAKNTELRQRIVERASRYNGLCENPPNSNNVIFWDWWANADGVVQAHEINGPWCGAYVSKVYEEAGVPLPPIQRDRGGFMFVPAATEYAVRTGEAITDLVPLPGDIVIYSWDTPTWSEGLPFVWWTNPADGRSAWWVAGDHVGIFSHMEGGLYWCWEGNTSSSGGSQDNGGEVALRPRTRSQIALFWRPASLAASGPTQKDDDMALTVYDAVKRPNPFNHDGIDYTVWDVPWLPENGRIITGPSGSRLVEYSAVSVALVEPDHAAHGPVYVFVYDENGVVGRMDLTNLSQLYFPRIPGRQSFACAKPLLVTARECLMSA